jgi:hypothetical protein
VYDGAVRSLGSYTCHRRNGNLGECSQTCSGTSSRRRARGLGYEHPLRSGPSRLPPTGSLPASSTGNGRKTATATPTPTVICSTNSSASSTTAYNAGRTTTRPRAFPAPARDAAWRGTSVPDLDDPSSGRHVRQETRLRELRKHRASEARTACLISLIMGTSVRVLGVDAGVHALVSALHSEVSVMSPRHAIPNVHASRSRPVSDSGALRWDKGQYT